MANEILSLAQKLISIRSIAGNHKALRQVLNLVLSKLNNYTIENFENNGIPSALVYNTPVRPEKFKIILNAHLDVIPGKEEQYLPRVEGDKLFGVGAMDMKANAACIIMAFSELAKDLSYPIALQLTTDEEIGGFDGTKYQIEQGIRGDFVLTSEPTNFDIVHEAKGILWLKISTKGTTAHGAYPWKGQNAIWDIQDFLNKLKKAYPVPVNESWCTTVNLSQIGSTNNVYNKIPADCWVGLDVRFIENDGREVLETIKNLLPVGASMEVLANEPSLHTAASDNQLQLLKNIGSKILSREIVLRGANGSSDARHYAQVGGAGIEFGPVGGNIGADDEWVSISSLNEYYQIIKKFLLGIN